MKKWIQTTIFAVAVSVLAMTPACSAAAEIEVKKVETAEEVPQALIEVDNIVSYTEEDKESSYDAETAVTIRLQGTEAVTEGEGISIGEDGITITKSGVYILEGQWTGGSILVNAEEGESIRLILNGVDIQSSENSAIYNTGKGKLILTLAEQTENKISDSSQYVYASAEEDEPDAAIFSKGDLTINGTGTLHIFGNYKKGIKTKDELKIMEGTLQITAVDDGIIGRDLVAVHSGNITITAQGDGIRSTYDTDLEKGNLLFESGTISIVAGKDGIQAENGLYIVDGTFTIVSGGGASAAEPKETENFGGGRGMPRENNAEREQQEGEVPQKGEEKPPIETEESAPPEKGTPPELLEGDRENKDMPPELPTETEEDTGESTKALKAGNTIVIDGGTFQIDACDDGIHSNDTVSIQDGSFVIKTGDDGVHGDGTVAISGGLLDIEECYEGVEGKAIELRGGEIHIVSSDDGVNAADGTIAQPAPGQATDDTIYIEISGGLLTVNAGGDGLDSNGDIRQTGGTILVNGPEHGADTAIDYDGTYTIDGGILVAAGQSSPMQQSPSASSTQTVLEMTFTEQQEAGTLFHIEGEDGTELLTYMPSKAYNSLVISTPNLETGNTYTAYYGGTVEGDAVGGYYENGVYSGGTSIGSFTVQEGVTYLTEQGVTDEKTTGQGGFDRKGGRGQRLERTENMEKTE